MKGYNLSQILAILAALQWAGGQSLDGVGNLFNNAGKAITESKNTVAIGISGAGKNVGDAAKSVGDKAKVVGDSAKGVGSNVGKVVVQEIADAKNPVVMTITYVGSSQCENVKRLIGVDYEQVAGAREPDLDSLKLDFKAPGFSEQYSLNSVRQLLPQSRGLDPSSKFVVFLHGFTDNPNKTNFQNINDAFQKIGHYNILALDASTLIRWLYLRSSTYIRFIGEKLGETLAALVQQGLEAENIHLIGHSLGAHISAFAGKKFTQLTGHKVGRLTGLDPAGPCFSHVDPELRLKDTDAEFVDAIHTDAGVYGIKGSDAQVDFFPNGGTLQPNCFSESCSHSRAVELFTESITNREILPAVRCDSYDQFKNGQCSQERNLLGLRASPTKKGKFYLQTNKEAPYGSGEKGLRYENRDGVVKSIGTGVDNQVNNIFGRKIIYNHK